MRGEVSWIRGSVVLILATPYTAAEIPFSLILRTWNISWTWGETVYRSRTITWEINYCLAIRVSVVPTLPNTPFKHTTPELALRINKADKDEAQL